MNSRPTPARRMPAFHPLKTHRLLAACAVALCAFQIPTRLHAAGIQYTVTDLGLFGQVRGIASGINASGQVVGWAETSGNSAQHAVV